MTDTAPILDLFAGPGGWSEGLRTLGLRDHGIEWDTSTCDTRRAADHDTREADLRTVPVIEYSEAGVVGLIASPPCQSFSIAGRRGGLDDPRGELVWMPLAWIATLQPEWVAMEQVPPVLPIWRQIALVIREYGYNTWTGVLNAADYGVPQTRERAIFMAHRRRPVAPPSPTHAEQPERGFFGPELRPWVTMAEALGWGATERPYVTLAGGTEGGPAYDFIGGSGGRRTMLREREEGRWVKRPWPWQFPATTVAGDPRISARCHHEDGSQGKNAKTTEQVQDGDYEGTEPIRLTVAEASILQGFRDDYPWQGTQTSKHLQIGNAIPPPLAAAIIGALAVGEGR